jgi:putative transposase
MRYVMPHTLNAWHVLFRQEVPAGYYHVTARGIGGLFHDDHDRTWFLTLLTRLVRKEAWQCLAYCLMTNHYHLVLRVRDATLSRGIQWLNGLYAQTFNQRHHRRGHLFEGRFRLTFIETEEHLAEACRYVVCNPVRAGLCTHPEEWAWSSYRATAGSPAAYAAYVDETLLQ